MASFDKLDHSVSADHALCPSGYAHQPSYYDSKFIWSSFNPKMSRFDPCRDAARSLFANKSLCCV